MSNTLQKTKFIQMSFALKIYANGFKLVKKSNFMIDFVKNYDGDNQF